MTRNSAAAALDFAERTGDDAAFDAAFDAYVASLYDPADECDAPADWDSGTVTFDPYI